MSEMLQSFLWLVIAIFGLQVPELAQHETANHQATDRDREVRCDENTAPAGEQQQGIGATPCESKTQEDDQSYLLETASPSDTMIRQGPQTAIARLNPEFVARLASAIREARQSGLPSAGIFSAYRPPAFGVGRFLDRFKSLHAYGLAVDMFGIGGPGSSEAKVWHEIAGRHGIFCPYGVDSKTEWNHCQSTPIRVVCPDNPLRKTITADGPIELAEMFKVGNLVADDPPTASCVAAAANRQEESDAITPRVARAASLPASQRPDHEHLRQARNAAVAANRPEVSDAITTHAARAASLPASQRPDREHLQQSRNAAVAAKRGEDSKVTTFHGADAASIAASERLARNHSHDARNYAGDAFARASRSDAERMRMVSADLRLGGVEMSAARRAAQRSKGDRYSTRHGR